MAAKKRPIMLKIAAAAGALCVLAVAAGVAWLATPQARDWAASRIIAMDPQRIAVEGVEGSLLGELRIGRLRFEGDGFAFEGEGLALHWRPSRLLFGTLSLRQIRARTLTYGSSGQTAAELPESLALPLRVNMDTLEIGQLRLPDLPEIRGLRLNYSGDAAGHRVRLLDIRVADCRLDGEARIAVQRPYPIDGSIRAGCGNGKELLDARLRLTGSLQTLQAELDAGGRGAKAQGRARLSPFSPQPLQELDLSAENIDTRPWLPGLPQARLTLRAAAAPSDGLLKGTLDLDNALAGSIDAGRMPFTGARLHWSLSSGRYVAENLSVALNGGGRINGSGHWQTDTGTGAAELQLRGITTARLDRRLQALRVDGQAVIRGDARQQRISARLNAAGAQLTADALHAGGRITLEKALLRAGRSEASLSGHLVLEGRQEYALRAALQRFDPSVFAAVPPAQLNGLVSAEGRLVPDWQAHITAKLADSRFRGRAFAASADFTGNAARWFDGHALVSAGRNRLELKGRYGQIGDILHAAIAADELRELDPGWNGRLHGQGTLSAAKDGLLLDIGLDAHDLSLPALRVARAGLHGSLAPGRNGSLRMNLDARNLHWSGLAVEQLQLSANGTRSLHRIEGRADGKALSLALAASGGLDASSTWRGTLDRLENGAPWALRLSSPATIAASPTSFSVEGLRAAFLGGSIGPLSLQWTPDLLRSQGVFSNVAVAPLLPRNTGLESRELRIGGEWRLDLAETLDGRLALRREAGDLAVSGNTPLPLQLRTAKLEARAIAGEIDATAEIGSVSMGTAELRARSRMLRRDGRWMIPGDTPLSGRLTLALRSLGWARVLAPEFDRIDGALTAQIEAGGSIAAPRLTGKLDGERIALRAIGPGVDLRDGRLRASLDGNRLMLNAFDIRAGRGRITASGNADLDGGLQRLELEARAESAQILLAPQWNATVSGSGKLGLRDRRIAINGRFVLDEGRYDLGNQTRPELGDDVIIRPAAGKPAERASTLPAQLDVSIDLNNRLALRGNGLDALLGGTVRVRSQATGLAATGSVRAVRGTYRIFNQTLDIERGTVSFGGSLTNPALDLRAMRKFTTAEVGVEVGGSLQRPQVKLVSTPDMPDSDRLAWLALGRDPQGSDRAQLAVLQAAALNLVSGGGRPLTGRIAEGAGLDELGFAGGEGEALGMVTLGKRLTDRLSIRLEQTLGGTAGSLLRMDYFLSERWRLRGTAGAENAGDILFTLRFD